VGELGAFYLVSIAESAESSWHTLELDGGFDSSRLTIEHECISILGNSNLTFEFMEGVRYDDSWFESRDASEVYPITYYLVDDRGNAYSLSAEESYSEAWSDGDLRGISIQNLSSLISSVTKDNPIWHAAKALRGKLYLFDWLSEVEDSGSSETSSLLLERGTIDLEEAIVMPSMFEQHLYESRQFLSYIYANLNGETPDYERAILCLNQALAGQYPQENIAFAAETLKLRAGYYACCNKPALSIKDYREAIAKYDQLKAMSELNGMSYDHELADCKCSLGLLMKDFGGDHIRHLSEAVELNPEVIKKLVQTAKLDRDTVRAILSCDCVSRDALKDALLVMSYEPG
jgi:tetratricopeptide (TPR) repeat protein